MIRILAIAAATVTSAISVDGTCNVTRGDATPAPPHFLIGTWEGESVIRSSASPPSAMPVTCPSFNFEDADVESCPSGWTCSGEAKVHSAQSIGSHCPITGGMQGSKALSLGCDNQQGEAVSNPITLPNAITSLRFKRSGGADSPSGVYVLAGSRDGAVIGESHNGQDTDVMFDVDISLVGYGGATVVIVANDKRAQSPVSIPSGTASLHRWLAPLAPLAPPRVWLPRFPLASRSLKINESRLVGAESSSWGKVAIDDIRFIVSGGSEASPTCSAPVTAERRLAARGLASTGEFTFVAAQMDWADALAHCLGLGLELASIHSKEEAEQAAALAASKGASNTWIGLNDRTSEGTWTWSDGVSNGPLKRAGP